MAYKSLYRKYRPNTFEEVSGQEFIVKTLSNAIKSKKTSHAYLFSGMRGTGKTTIAKIFARMMNCYNMETSFPCGKCPVCTTENTDEIQDIIEIDAASNNGVDEIRELRNKIKLVPVECKYKVYIIDEVHMLSTGAFNALLKTLEEPPEHVIFILATTEPEKLPITIISRCQRFDFKKLSSKDIEKRLKLIADKENIDISSDAILEIANICDGAMRDAIGLLDQVSSYSNKKVTIAAIYQVSGRLSYEKIYDVVHSYITNDTDSILKLVEDFYNEGKDFSKLVQDILYFLRNVLISKKAPNYFENNTELVKKYVSKISKLISDNELKEFINKIEKLSSDLKYCSYPRVLFELSFLNKDLKEISTKKEETIKPLVKEEKIKIKVTTEEKDYKRALINNTIAQATAKSKKSVESALNGLDKYLINKKYKSGAIVLKDGTVAAASENRILITYKYESNVEEHDNELSKINALMSELMCREYKTVALTEEQWKERRPYFLEYKKQGKNLELIEEIEELKIGLKNKEENEFLEGINIFGEELIEMEG